MRSFAYLLLLGALLLTLAISVRSGIYARKSPEEPINSAMRAALAETSPQLSTEDALAIARKFPTEYTMRSGLMYLERDRGTGTAKPKAGDTVIVNVDGGLLDGTPLPSAYRHGKSLTFQVGTGKVIKGWDEALLTMKKGARRTLIVPYWLGYGETGNPPMIPPRATLVFELELVDFHP
jgi:FKBP-type peptidyl-prolyl cis-trans isomerase